MIQLCNSLYFTSILLEDRLVPDLKIVTQSRNWNPPSIMTWGQTSANGTAGIK